MKFILYEVLVGYNFWRKLSKKFHFGSPWKILYLCVHPSVHTYAYKFHYIYSNICNNVSLGQFWGLCVWYLYDSFFYLHLCGMRWPIKCFLETWFLGDNSTMNSKLYFISAFFFHLLFRSLNIVVLLFFIFFGIL